MKVAQSRRIQKSTKKPIAPKDEAPREWRSAYIALIQLPTSGAALVFGRTSFFPALLWMVADFIERLRVISFIDRSDDRATRSGLTFNCRSARSNLCAPTTCHLQTSINGQ